ncbi:MAG: hypothetical protein LBN21_10335 [Treponema sp.]|jgi:hypothetical protein|nr:hypothetical protein [Treponema sp.]
MNFELLTVEKKMIILDLAVKAISLRPALAETASGSELPEKVIDFAKNLAESIEDAALCSMD